MQLNNTNNMKMVQKSIANLEQCNILRYARQRGEHKAANDSYRIFMAVLQTERYVTNLQNDT